MFLLASITCHIRKKKSQILRVDINVAKAAECEGKCDKNKITLEEYSDLGV